MHFPFKVKFRFNQFDCLYTGTAYKYAIASDTFMSSLEKQLFPLEKPKCKDNIQYLAGCHPLKTQCSCAFPHTALPFIFPCAAPGDAAQWYHGCLVCSVNLAMLFYSPWHCSPSNSDQDFLPLCPCIKIMKSGKP